MSNSEIPRVSRALWLPPTSRTSVGSTWSSRIRRHLRIQEHANCGSTQVRVAWHTEATLILAQLFGNAKALSESTWHQAYVVFLRRLFSIFNKRFDECASTYHFALGGLHRHGNQALWTLAFSDKMNPRNDRSLRSTDTGLALIQNMVGALTDTSAFCLTLMLRKKQPNDIAHTMAEDLINVFAHCVFKVWPVDLEHSAATQLFMELFAAAGLAVHARLAWSGALAPFLIELCRVATDDAPTHVRAFAGVSTHSNVNAKCETDGHLSARLANLAELARTQNIETELSRACYSALGILFPQRGVMVKSAAKRHKLSKN